MGTNHHGVYRLSENNTLTHLIPNGNITTFYHDSSDELWIGTHDNGIYHICREEEIKNICFNPQNPFGLSSNFVRSICEDNEGNFWIGTFNGLNQYRKDIGLVHNYTGMISKPESLTHSSVWSIVKDKQGTIWVGTYFGGVNYFNPKFEIYNRYGASEVIGEGLSSPVVGRMTEDNNGNIWICTEGGGVNILNRNTGKFSQLPSNSGPYSIKGRHVKAIYYDNQKEIMWIGTHRGGLNKLDLKTNQISHFQINEGDDSNLPSDNIIDIESYKENLLIATQNGVFIFYPATGLCQNLLKDNKQKSNIKNISDLLIDDSGKLWIATIGQGIYSYNFETEQLINYSHYPGKAGSLSNNNINSITQDRAGNIWIATSGGGLDRFIKDTHDFENFDSEKSGFSSNCIYGLVEAHAIDGEFLVISNQGFSIFSYYNHTFRNFNKENGFPLSAINGNALYLASDGEIFLGGIDGMISFYVPGLKFSPEPYGIVFSKLIVNGNEINPGDETGILEKSIIYTDHITLKAKQSMFTLEFTTSNFIPENKEDIYYKLEGFSDAWNRIRGLNDITYTNLNPGKYKLIIKACNNRELSEKEKTIKITVLPPLYKSNIAYIIYILFFVIFIRYLLKAYNAHVHLQESLKYEKKHRRDIEALNYSKMQFFTNISHEFRTPLTLIVGQVESLLQVKSFTLPVYNKLLGLYQSSLQLKELITELLDFRKQEQGLMKLKVTRNNLIDFLYENYLLFKEYALHNNIIIDFEKNTNYLEVWYDSRQMQKVINNLLSNALKYTDSNGTIKINVRCHLKNALIEISDTGSGIDSGDIDKIFDPFFQTERNNFISSPGTGIGLAIARGIIELHHGKITVKSESGKGSTFTVYLPLGNEHFTAEQIGRKPEIIDTDSELRFINTDPIPGMEPDREEENSGKEIPKATIIIVEDHKTIRDLLSGIFSPYYRVITACDGEDAYGKILQEMPDIILSDILMPRMTGTELCKQIKSNPETCHIPVVLLTARTSLEHNIEGLQFGADDYITKPFNTKLLLTRCSNLINSRRILHRKFSNLPETTVKCLATNSMDKIFLDNAMRIMENHLDNMEFNINLFAREMGISRSGLFHKMKAITGMTPNEFILNVRLKKAAYLLRNNPELNISNIADKLGFSSSRYFSKCFRDAYNINPFSYRKGINGEISKPGNEKFSFDNSRFTIKEPV